MKIVRIVGLLVAVLSLVGTLLQISSRLLLLSTCIFLLAGILEVIAFLYEYFESGKKPPSVGLRRLLFLAGVVCFIAAIVLSFRPVRQTLTATYPQCICPEGKGCPEKPPCEQEDKVVPFSGSAYLDILRTMHPSGPTFFSDKCRTGMMIELEAEVTTANLKPGFRLDIYTMDGSASKLPITQHVSDDIKQDANGFHYHYGIKGETREKQFRDLALYPDDVPASFRLSEPEMTVRCRYGF